MFRWIVPILIGVFTICPLATGQDPTLQQLMAEVQELRQEVQRLRGVEARLHALQARVAAHSGEPVVAGAGNSLSSIPVREFDVMPYEEDVVYLVGEVRSEGVSSPGSDKIIHRIAVDLLAVPEAALGQAPAYNVLGERYRGFPGGIPTGVLRHRMVMEKLGPSDALAWIHNLKPRRQSTGDPAPPIYREVRFARVRTDEVRVGTYSGNSGTVMSYRGGLYWNQSSVFFLEEGRLHLVGGISPRYHLRFVHDGHAPVSR